MVLTGALRHLRTFLIALLLTGLLGFLGFSQEAGNEQEAMSPFVSGLRVAIRDPRVRLTWREEHDNVALHRIYRAGEEIREDNFDEAKLVGTVDADTETFVDVPSEEGSYYYAVLSETKDGELRTVFLPFRNKTTQAAEISAVADRAEPPAEVISISAERRGDEILLRFQANRPNRNLAVFRSTKELASLDDLALATRIDIVESDRRSYTDFPVPGISYFYGAFDTEAVAEGEISFDSDRNVSSRPVRIPIDVATVSRTIPEEQLPRRRPLPFLMIDETLREGRSLARSPLRLTAARRELSEETASAVEAALGPLPSPEDQAPPKPVILPEERLTDAKGPRFTLKTIAEGPFAAGRWQEASRLLENMLTISLPQDVEARVHFYLGQTRYFSGDTRRAFLEFVLARELYFLETKPWIDRVILDLNAS
jgi:hypothetical protein